MSVSKHTATGLAASLCLSALPQMASASSTTAYSIIDQMGSGWNLSNTMDALANQGLNDETGWGNPKTTQAMIDLVKNSGMHTLRVPVSWDDNISGAPNFTINSAWMDRVEQIVNYGLNDGLYVIINVHHNYGWESTTPANESNATTELKKLWSQIAPRFQKYDRHLIFEVMNEPRTVGSVYNSSTGKMDDDWWGTTDNMAVVNRLDAAALSVIRGTGGNNATRLVMVPDYAAGSDPHQMSAMVVPNDSMVAVSIHAYTPFDFSMNANGTPTFVTTEVDNLFKNLKTYFVSKNIPVVLGEWGAEPKNNLSERVKHAEYYAKAAKAARIPCVMWDMGQLMNRTSTPPNWTFPTVIQAMVSGWGSVATGPAPVPIASPLNQMLLEAENAQLLGGAAAVSDASRSNGAYVNLQGGSIVWTDSLTKAGTYDIVLTMDSPYGPKTNTFFVDGDSSAFTVDSSVVFGPVTVVKAVTLQPGKHTFTLGAQWGWIDVDYLKLVAPTAGIRSFATAGTPKAVGVPGGLRLDGIDGIRQIRVMDVSGRTLAISTPRGSSVTIPLDANGMVLVSFEDATGIVSSSKVVLP